MPKLMLPIPEVDDMVTRPVIFDITRQLIKATRLPKDIDILMPYSEERVAQNKSTIGSDKEDVHKFPSINQMIIDATETIEDDAILTRAVLKPEHIPVLVDQMLGIVLVPVYAQTSVELNFTNKFTDKASANRWRDEMRNKIAMLRDVVMHTATYSYTIPLAYIAILKEIHRLRENQGGYGDSFDEYLNTTFSPNVTDITNTGGNVVRKGVRETQQRIQGWFDFSSEPERGNKDGEADAWSISFTYKFCYQKPLAVRMTYPLAIHNQMLSTKFRPGREDKPTPRPFDKEQSWSGSMNYFRHFESEYDYITGGQRRGKLVPDFDEFSPDDVVKGTYNMVSWMLGLQPDNTIDLISLKDLPKVTMKENIHQFLLQSELPFILEEHKSVFQLQLYETYKNDRLPADTLFIDKNGNVSATQNLDIREPYHLRLGIYYDWSLLDDDALDRLRKWPGVVDDLICYLWPWRCGEHKKPNNHGVIPKDEMKKETGGENGKDGPIFPTVQTLYLDVVRYKVDDD